MRNDLLDEMDNVPSLKPERDDRPLSRRPTDGDDEPYREPVGHARPARRGPSTAPLWVLVAALTLALAGVAWWSHQQLVLMQDQVVATQENFARISEDAQGRLRDISGKLVESESSGTTSREALLLQVKTLQTKVAELSRQQQGVADNQQAQDNRLQDLTTALETVQNGSGTVDSHLKALADEQAALKTGLTEQVASLTAQNKALQADIAALKKPSAQSQSLGDIQQDLLVLRSELDARPVGPDSKEFDAFRLQTTRNITTLQSQVQNLQQQISSVAR
ncbi:ATPase [Pseudomonas oryzihabitans]|uniref:ATPase n=1 Tax=Pseudomonas oryzihabitans TaxID=47885 RepID=UPI00285BE2DC|nr:ATPase [Pseudomonas psychrotolerans]MDR6678394.1 chromosome segregation ATPase [Pseudomonas psychrotolerans]